MSICDKIQNIGDTLETNLNARGVSCTFGTGAGESTILDMAEMITNSNLKGSADTMISIAASRPYLLSGEKTDLIVTLKNGLGVPLANKSVTVSDGTSSYSGITNNQGVYKLYDVSVIGDTTFTATYSTVSDSVRVELCSFIDYAVTSNHNDDWVKYNSSNQTLTRGEAYTSSSGSSYRYGTTITKSCKIRCETRKTTQSTGTLLSIWTYNSNPTSASQLLTFSVTEMGMTQGTFANIEMVVTSSSVTVTNLDNNTTITKEYSTTKNLEVNFWGTIFDYRNFRIVEV